MTENKTVFDKLIAKPFVLLSGFYMVFVLLLTILGFSYIYTYHNELQNAIPPKLSDSLSVIPVLAAKDPSISTAIELKSITAPTPAMLEKGKTIFANVCSSCHGIDGKGDGVAGAALNPKPRNFQAADSWKNGRKVSEIYKTLQFGVPKSAMPSYDILPPEEKLAVISYVRTLMTNAPMDTDADIAMLDKTYQLTKGIEQPGQIPVDRAAAIITDVYLPTAQKVKTKLELLSADTDNAGFHLFKRVSSSPEQALLTVAENLPCLSSPGTLRNFIQKGVGRNGFNASFNLLSDADLSNLFSYLKTKLVQ